MIARYQSLLGHIHEKTPHSQIYLASIIGMPTTPSFASCSVAFNSRLPALVDEWAQKGMDIVYVPMYEQSGVCVGPNNPGWKPDQKPLEGLCCSAKVHRIGLRSSMHGHTLYTYMQLCRGIHQCTHIHSCKRIYTHANT